MRYFTLKNNNEYKTYSEKEIIEEYYSSWYRDLCKQYSQAFVDETFSFDDCVDAWVYKYNAVESN